MGDPASVKILFFNEDGLEINSSMSKNVEIAFFKEEFRRVTYDDIGEIMDSHHHHHVHECLSYKEAIENKIDKNVLAKKHFHIVVDLLSGSSAEIFPKILNDLHISNILLNVYADEIKLSHLVSAEKHSKNEVSAIVKSLNSDVGFMLYPNGQRLTVITDEGEILENETLLFVILYLLNIQDSERKYKVMLPSSAPDIMDESFENLEIERGKYTDFKTSKLKAYDLMATVDGNFAFCEFTLHHDSMYACLKIIEMLMKFDLKLSEIVKKVQPFYYSHTKIACIQSLKGTMMRKFLSDAKNKESSSVDGVKIWHDKHDWILMIPDQYEDALNLYIQAKTKKRGESLLEKYKTKIENWAK
jgi:mannose-1-phosphate guanylyltransferase/phosphomannomutase